MLKSIIRGIVVFEKLFIYISGVFMGLLALFVFYEVVARYVFNSPTVWANEFSTYILQFIVFLSMGYLFIRDKHVKVTFLIDKLNGVARKFIQILAALLVIPYAIVLTIYGFQYTSNAYNLGMVSPSLLEFPLWIPYSFIPMGGLLLVLASICTVLKIIINEEEEIA
ncbi:TRAP transporter small permease [Oceanobacillus saliphilus]|uniref:TRAP transporter small permease n=1 Tax=Oceanobacillus saliphilus TaxID=2925834 RepID=UPI00201DE401|nr:TRAP transporter small permease [Oceanobacillus saliphilus]